jgi:hypothetical protein
VRTKELLQHVPIEKSNVLRSHISVIAVGKLFGKGIALQTITEFLNVFIRIVNIALDRIETIGEFFKVRNMKLDLLGTKVLRNLKMVEQDTTLGKNFGQFLRCAGGEQVPFPEG